MKFKFGIKYPIILLLLMIELVVIGYLIYKNWYELYFKLYDAYFIISINVFYGILILSLLISIIYIYNKSTNKV